MKSKKSFFELTIYKKTIARFWPLWAAYLVFWLILLPLQGLTELRLDANNTDLGIAAGKYMTGFANRDVPGQAEGALYLALIFGVLAAMAVFSHLYSARSANLFGSLPVRREGLFLTHYLAGLSFLLVPNLIVFALTLAVEGAGGCVVMEGLLFWLGVSCGECFFFYSLAVFCAMFTGHLLALPAFYGIVNVLVYGILELLQTVMSTFYYGFAGFGDWVGRAVRWFTPMLNLGRGVRSNWTYAPSAAPVKDAFDYDAPRVLTTQGLGTVGVYALAAVVLTVCAFLLYRARRLESAGDVVSVKPMRPVFKYGVAFCAGLVFGYGTSYFLGTGETFLMGAILFWAIVGYFGAQMLLDKSFRVLGKWKGAAAVAGAFVVMFLVVGLDLTGYETRIPDPASVKSVYVDGLNAIYLRDYGDSVVLNVDDPDQIALFVGLHRAAVEQRDEEVQTRAMLGGVSTWLELRYELANGSTLSRQYHVWVDPDDVEVEGSGAWCVEQLYHDRDLYWRAYGFDELEEAIARGGRLESAEYSQYDDTFGWVNMPAGYGKDARMLLEAVKEDFRAGRIGVRTLTDERVVESRGYMDMADELYFRVTDPADGDVLFGFDIALQDTATSTIAALDRLGIDRTPGAVWEWQQEQGEAYYGTKWVDDAPYSYEVVG